MCFLIIVVLLASAIYNFNMRWSITRTVVGSHSPPFVGLNRVLQKADETLPKGSLACYLFIVNLLLSFI